MLRRLLLAFGLLCVLATPALATTTFTAGTNCPAGFNVTGGGLTVASTANGYQTCFANNPKWSGLKYFEVTFVTNGNLYVGLANNGNGSPFAGVPSANGGWSTNTNNYIGVNYTSISYLHTVSSGAIYWGNNALKTSIGTTSASQVVAIAADFNSNPPQFWVAPNATNLVCNGSGGSGSSAPQYNGNCTSDPSIPGSGAGNTGGTGVNFFLQGFAYFPVFQTNGTGQSATYNFGGSGFAGVLPTGYSSWDDNSDSSSNAPNPGPTNAVSLNIANAPGWAASTSYAAGKRVVAGPGWAPGSPGSFTSGSALYLWAIQGAGGTSGGSPPAGFSSCPTPAAYGGGFTGSTPSQWSGATTVSDNGLTWVCLTKVDNVTLTGAFFDTSTAWSAGATFYYGQRVTNTAGQVFKMTAARSSPFTCTTGGSAPSWVTTTLYVSTTSDNTCTWTYVASTLVYSSQTGYFPPQVNYAGSSTYPNAGFNWPLTINVWYGGSAQQLYQPGQNNENIPLLMTDHGTLTDGAGTIAECKNAYFFSAYVLFSPSSANGGLNACAGLYSVTGLNFTVAPGDSIVDNVANRLGVDSTKGVEIYNNATPTGSWQYYYTEGESIAIDDTGMNISRFQFVSTQGGCLTGGKFGGPGLGITNNDNFFDNIMDCGGTASGARGAFAIDAGGYEANNLIIYRGTQAGSFGTFCFYPCAIFNNTIVGNSATNGTAIQNDAPAAGFWASGGSFFPAPFNNNVFIGFPNCWAVNTTNWTSGNISAQTGANNATDRASCPTGGTFTSTVGRTYTQELLPGISGSGCNGSASCYGLTPSTEFVNPTIGSSENFKVKSTSSLIYSGGGAFSKSTGGSWMGTLVPGPDIFGTVRPVSGRYDIGAEMFVPAAANGLPLIFGVP